MTDDTLVETLRRLDRTGYPGRGDRLDPGLVVRAGRRRRVLRRTVAGTGALVLALAVGASAALAGRTTSEPPAGETPDAPQQPRTFGDRPAAVLEPGVAAVNLPQRRAGGALVATDVAGLTVTVSREGDDVHVVVEGGDVAGPVSLSLPDGGSVRTYDHAGTAYPNASEYGRGNAPMGLLVGVLPSWQRDPSAYLFSVPGWDPALRGSSATPGATELPRGGSAGADEVARFAELPTFRPPGDDGRLMYVVVLTGEAHGRIGGSPHAVAFVGSDGDAFWPGCGRSTGTGTAEDPGTCADRLGVPEDDLWITRAVAFEAGASTTPCAEFPPRAPSPGDAYEGWWNSTPADADGNVVTAPALWPEPERSHPRVALVATDTGDVLSTWDRVACGPAPGYVPTPRADWPPSSIAVVDMDTGETVGTFPDRRDG